MPDGSVPLLIALVILIIFSGFFSSTETAYSCANRIKLRSLASDHNKRAEKVLVLAEEKYDRLISTILIGNNIVNITATTIATILFAMIIKDAATANLVSTIVMTVVVLIFGEITPKLLAKLFPEKFAMGFYPVVMFFYYLLYPFNMIFSGWRWLLTKIIRVKEEDVVTEAEIMTIVEEAEDDGTLKAEETQLIRQVIEFDDLEVGDILIPRVNIVAVDIESSMEDIRKVFENEGYSRLPVYKNSIDTVIGTIHERDFYTAYLHGKKGLDGIMQNAFYTTEHVKISNLLHQLQKKKIHIAIVLDEYGGTLGLITLEDILEELVGEIYDEHDEEINYFNPLNDNVTMIDGNAPLSDTFEFLGLEDEDDKFDANTLSGWIIEQLGDIPHTGANLKYMNINFEVTKASVKRVLMVKVTKEQVKETEE